MFSSHSIKYGLVGVFNTIIGYGTTFILFYFQIVPEIANAIGYFIGFLVSYFLNKKYTFSSKRRHREDMPRFFVGMLVSYLANITTFIFLFRFLGVNEFFTQFISGGVYVLVGYSISKLWVFNKENLI
ncbi:GtrA family protein [Vibrio sp. M260118]|uniref:GtrA family protein n=1 Tax=Vibrio sp. M260118 TaxID=3020896 RepID=UPI002F3FF01F